MNQIKELLSELGYDAENIRSSMEPANSKDELLKLESLFNIDTNSILGDNETLFGSVSSVIIKKWISLYDTFSFFGGKDIEINSNQRKSYLNSYKEAVDQKNWSTASLL